MNIDIKIWELEINLHLFHIARNHYIQFYNGIFYHLGCFRFNTHLIYFAISL